MSNEVVKFSNQFNNQALRKFTALDLDVLMAIATKVRDKRTEEVDFTFDELRRLTRLRKNMTDEEMARQIIEVNDRLLALHFRFQDGSATIQFALFSFFETDPEKATLRVAVNERFAFLLNDLTSNFTRFELREFVDLKSSYAKEFYRRARQYRATGVWAVSLDDFRRLLDIPKSYRITNIYQSVLTPIEDELGPRIHLTVERQYSKKSPGRGRRSLSGFVFRFRFPDPTGKPVAVIEGKAVPAKPETAERRRNGIARDWFDAHEGDCKAPLAQVAAWARKHEEIPPEELPNALEKKFCG